MMQGRIPVILDTDIGSDIDDTWALGMMLNCPELDVKLIVSATGDTLYRAKLIAKFLESVGRADIPIGIGVPSGEVVLATNGETHESRLATWVEDYDLEKYPGKIYHDGVDAIIHAVDAAAGEATLIAIAPLTNIGEVLRRSPGTAAKCRFVGMQGSVYWGYGKKECVPEYNVRKDVEASRKTFASQWKSFMITPLDTCEKVVLRGDAFQSLIKSDSAIVKVILENYRIWGKKGSVSEYSESTCLFDTVAIYMAFSTEFLSMRGMSLSVTDEGRFMEDSSAQKIDVALDWKEQGAFEEFLIERLIGG